MTSTQDLAAQYGDELIALRRELHKVPELDRHLPKTQALILEALEGLDLEITLGKELSSVTAVLRGGKGPGQVVLLRGDMDALPVQELLDIDYVSTHPGQMHACGHDLHVAALVGAAKILHAQRDELRRRRGLHVPARRGDLGRRAGDDGRRSARHQRAARRCGVRAACHLHRLSAGHVVQPAGHADGQLRRVHRSRRRRGRPRLGAAPHQGPDPGRLRDGARDPDHGRAHDRLQRPRHRHRRHVPRGHEGEHHPRRCDLHRDRPVVLRRAAQADARRLHPAGRGRGRRARSAASTSSGCPAIRRPSTTSASTSWPEQTLVDLFGADRFHLEEHADPGVEDFAYVAEAVPSAYVSISACSADDPASAPDNHSPLAHFDDSVLPDCAAFLAEVAIRRLAQGG